MGKQQLSYLEMLGQEYIDAATAWYKHAGLSLAGIPYIKDQHGRLVNQDGSEIVRDITREKTAIRNYLLSQNSDYQKEIQRFAEYFPQMSSACRFVIQIPAYNEELNIYHTLTEWASQRSLDGKILNSSIYEINVLTNGPKGYKRDATLDKIKDFKRAFPFVNINVVDVEFPLDTGNVGMARKLLTDLLLQRSINRPDQQASLYIESADADILKIDERLIAKRIQKFDSKPYLDALSGQHCFPPAILIQNDHLLFALASHYFATILLGSYTLRPERNKDFSFYNHALTFGWNSAFTAEAYALVGGYLPVQMGEDFDIGRRIAIMRGMADNQGRFIPNTHTIERCHTRMMGSVRRIVHAFAQNAALYAEFGDIKNMNGVRAFNPDKMVAILPHDKLSPENIAVFEKCLTNEWRFFIRTVKNPAIRLKIFHRLMIFLGFGRYRILEDDKGNHKILSSWISNEDTTNWTRDYHISSEDEVKIDNIGNIKYFLACYRENKKRR